MLHDEVNDRGEPFRPVEPPARACVATTGCRWFAREHQCLWYLGSGSGSGARVGVVLACQTLTLRKRKALAMTETELRLIAALASMGLSSKPKKGYSAPAAIGTPNTL